MHQSLTKLDLSIAWGFAREPTRNEAGVFLANFLWHIRVVTDRLSTKR